MSNLKLIVRREYFARVKNKTFVVMTFLSPIIMVLMVMLIAYLTSLSKGEYKVLGVYDESGLFVSEFLNTPEIQYQDLSGIDLAQAETIVKEQEFYGLLYIPSVDNGEMVGEVQFLSKEAPGFGFLNQFEEIIGGELTRQNLVRNGIDLRAIRSSEVSVDIEVKNFSGERTSEVSNYVKMFFGGAAGYLLMMFIIIYGNMVMRSVIEEKTNRIVEIIISSVKPIQLMLGKILGTSLAGITQFFIWVVLGSILLFIASSVVGVDLSSAHIQQQGGVDQFAPDLLQQITLDILKLPLVTLTIAFLLYFIGGYFLYSSIYAAIGAAVDNETDTQQFMFPLILPLMLGIYVGFFAVIENPHGTVATVFSLIPLTSPIVMLMRIPFGVPWWELIISMTLLIISIAGVIWLAAKIYRVGILMYGKKPGYKDLIKWLKY